MKLGLALGIASFALAIYGLFKSEKKPVEVPANVARAPRVPSRPGLPTVDETLASKCGLMSSDLADADRWSGGQLGYTLDLRARLSLMHSKSPIALWPAYARRAWCALTGQGADAAVPVGKAAPKWTLPGGIGI